MNQDPYNQDYHGGEYHSDDAVETVFVEAEE